jgi:hypothetical protein
MRPHYTIRNQPGGVSYSRDFENDQCNLSDLSIPESDTNLSGLSKKDVNVLIDSRLSVMKSELMEKIEHVDVKAEAANKTLSARVDECINVSKQLKATMEANHSELVALLMNNSKPSAQSETKDQAHSSCMSPVVMTPSSSNNNNNNNNSSSSSSTPAHNIVIHMSGSK